MIIKNQNKTWKNAYHKAVYELNGLRVKIIDGTDLGTYFIKTKKKYNSEKYGPYTKKEITELTKRLQRHNSKANLSDNTISSNKDFLKVAWKYVECEVPNCWCGLIYPEPLLRWEEDMTEAWIVGAGSVPKEIAKYIVELHNNNLIEKMIEENQL